MASTSSILWTPSLRFLTKPLSAFSANTVWEALQARREVESDPPTPADLRFEEYKALCAPSDPVAQADQRYTAEIEDAYAGTDLPVLVCWGADDEWIPAETGRKLAARFPRARFQLIPGAGHLVQEDRPAELTAALLSFLARS